MDTSIRSSLLWTSMGGIITASALSMPAVGAVRVDTSELREAVSIDGVRAHQAAFQAAADMYGGGA